MRVEEVAEGNELHNVALQDTKVANQLSATVRKQGKEHIRRPSCRCRTAAQRPHPAPTFARNRPASQRANDGQNAHAKQFNVKASNHLADADHNDGQRLDRGVHNGANGLLQIYSTRNGRRSDQTEFAGQHSQWCFKKQVRTVDDAVSQDQQNAVVLRRTNRQHSEYSAPSRC